MKYAMGTAIPQQFSLTDIKIAFMAFAAILRKILVKLMISFKILGLRLLIESINTT
jgi:hypothetical protein